MGCFSCKCDVCGEGVNSTSFIGEMVELFFLKNGIVIEQLSGEYDSYGRVFVWDIPQTEAELRGRISNGWQTPWPEICDLWHNDDPRDGLAFIHTNCWDGTYPTRISQHDPDQGWNMIKEFHLPEEAKTNPLYQDVIKEQIREEEEYYDTYLYEDEWEDYEEFDEDED